MAWNLNYPDYEEMGVAQNNPSSGPYGSYGSNPAPTNSDAGDNGAGKAGEAATGIGGATGNPYIAAAGLGLQAYGQYEKSKEAEKQYARMVQAWQMDQDRRDRLDEEQRAQQYFTNALASANYGQGVKTDARSQYGKYATSYGL